MKNFDVTKIPAANLARISQKQKEKADPINNTELINRFRAEGGSIVHVRPRFPGQRGVTVAYKPKNGRIEMATAVQHKNDVFTKRVGTKIAIEHFDAGCVVILPTGPNYPRHIRNAINALYSFY